MNRRQFLVGTPLLAGVRGLAQEPLSRIRSIDIIHHTHLDVGYTDVPSVVRDKQKRYLDAAIDLCSHDPAFRWTVETLVELDDWWQTAPAASRSELIRLIRAGQMDVMGLPCNQTPFLNALQWKQMMSWIPADRWKLLNPRVAMQNDVNGFPRTGAIHLLDRGIRHLLMGINSDSGGPPFRRPSAFWWKMPDSRRLFVWSGEHYGRAINWFGATRDGGLPDSEEFVRRAHANVLKQARTLEDNGYGYERLILTFTHPAAWDNGSPYPQLGPFIKSWNRLGLQPKLRFVTATEAVLGMERLVGANVPVMEGEWTDWWANGDASGPREVTASRFAKRYLSAAMSPVWGPMPASTAPETEGILKDLCLFDEHTWGASSSISAPYALKTIAQYTEKSDLAYRPMAKAEWLLTRRARTKLAALPNGVHVVNATAAELSGWAVPGGGTAAGKTRVWVEKIAPHSVRAVSSETAGSEAKPGIQTDANGWPVSATWPGMRKPLFQGSLGEFICVGLIPPADRRTISRLHANPDAEKREAIRRDSLKQTTASYSGAKLSETPHTVVYEQAFQHPRLEQAGRTLEIWKREPRARISIRFNRISSVAPELLYLAFALPEGTPMPKFSCGGLAFTPYRDQIPGSCRDYFGIDGHAHYSTPDGDWLWVTRDAPLAVVGGPHALERHQSEPQDTHRIVSMVFDNCWHTNFVADSHGTMEFQYEVAWRDKIANPSALAEALAADPILLTTPAVADGPAILRNLYKP